LLFAILKIKCNYRIKKSYDVLTDEIELILGAKTGKFQNLIYIKNEDLELPHGQNYVFAIEELDKIQNSLIDGMLLPKLFQYDKISLWWVIYQSLIPEFKKVINFTHQFKKLLDHEKITKVTIKNNFDKLYIIKQICNEKNIQLHYSNSQYLKFKIKSKGKNSIQKKRYSKIFEQKINQRIKIFEQKSKKLPDIKNKIIFPVSTNFHRDIFDFSKNNSTKGEYLITPLMNMFEDDQIIGIDLDYTFSGQFDILSERLSNKIPWIPIEKFLEKTNQNNQNLFIEKYKKIITDEKFQNLFQFDNIFLWSYLKNFFEKMMFSPYIPFYIQLIDELTIYFSNNKPKAVIIPYETGSIALIIIAVLKLLHVKTIGVQHGYIYPNSPMYSQTNFHDENNVSGYILPDHFLVFGEYVKNLLTKIGYPKEKLVSFGNPSLFKLQNFFDNFSEDAVRNKLGIDSTQKIILFTTGKMQRNYSSAGIYDYDEKIWKSLLLNFKDNDEYFIILKPHPTELDTSAYATIQRDIKNKNSLIIQHDLFELIQIASVLVSVVSSSMFEALSFQKPVIQVKFKDEIHPILDDANIVLKTNLSNLLTTITNLETDENLRNKFKLHAKQFIKYHYGIPEINPDLVLKEILEI
jgi:hypothetical protein